MCGIAGLLGLIQRDEAYSALRAMLDAQAHRGPDDVGQEVLEVGGKTVGLGNRRLAIIDLSPLGHQPMSNPETGDVLVFNGEIYNFQEIRSQLQRDGFAFKSRSDTEVLLRAYQKWGAGCLDHLRGMFAVAIWDARRARLILARDHLGIKPLYYASLPGKGLFFASETKAIVASGQVPESMDRRALATYLAYGAVQQPLTINSNIKSLSPGLYMEVDPTGEILHQNRYWTFPVPGDIHEQHIRNRTLIEEGKQLLVRAVKRHLVSDVPVGVFQSAGLDSSAISGIAAELSPETIQAFTVTFPDQQALNEGPAALSAMRNLGVTNHECPVTNDTALNWAKRWLTIIDQPSIDGLNTYIVARAIKERGIVVALSGQGSDELFGGYPSFHQIPRLRRLLLSLSILPATARGTLARVSRVKAGAAVAAKISDIAAGEPSLESIYFHHRRLLSDQHLSALGFTPADYNLTRNYQVPERNGSGYVIPNDAVATVQRMETTYYLGNMLLRDGDVCSMASSLELRVPFLDRDLVDWAMRIPGKCLLPPGAPGKYLLREMCHEYYTDEQIHRSKTGFALPFSAWLLGPLRETMEEGLHLAKESGLMNPHGIERIRSMFLQEPATPAWSRLWALVVLGHWTKNKPAVCTHPS